MALVLQALPDIALSISATTRAPRAGDKEGISYFFKSDAEFDAMIAQDELVEWAEIHGRRYGTPAAEIKKALNEGKDLILEIDPQGYEQVVARFPEALSVFIAPPSFEVLRERLAKRATESAEAIQKRLRTAEVELGTKDRYNAVIVNDDLATAAEELVDLIRRHQRGEV